MRIFKTLVLISLMAGMTAPVLASSTVLHAPTDGRKTDGFVVPAQIHYGRTETMTVTLYDSYGDGWDGAFMDVLVDGALVLDDITVPHDGGYGNGGIPHSWTFPAEIGQIVSTVYTSGSYESEHSYYFYNAAGQQVASDGPAPSPGISFEVAAPFVAPDNDLCVNAETVTFGTPVSGTMAGATDIVEECLGEAAVWYTFTLAEDARVVIDYCASQDVINTIAAALYTDCECGGQIGYDESNFDCGNPYIDFFCVPAGTYYYPVFGPSGAFEFTITTDECHDPCAGYECAASLSLPATAAGTTVGAPNFVTAWPAGAAGDVVYCVTSDEDCISDISLCESDFDTKLIVYDEFPCPQPGAYLAYNDDSYDCTGSYSSKSLIADFEFLAGVTYYVLVTGYSSHEGEYVLDIPGCPTVEAAELATSFELTQNYPNPFNPTTTIEFSLSQADMVSLAVFDLAGREVASLVDGMMETGSHSVVFDAGELSSGVYFYTLQANGMTSTKKMVLMK